MDDIGGLAPAASGATAMTPDFAAWALMERWYYRNECTLFRGMGPVAVAEQILLLDKAREERRLWALQEKQMHDDEATHSSWDCRDAEAEKHEANANLEEAERTNETPPPEIDPLAMRLRASEEFCEKSSKTIF